MFRYLEAFAEYNPLQDKLPEQLFWEIGYLEQQARSLLPEDFTLTDLNACLEIIFQLKKFRPKVMLEHFEKIDKKLKPSDGVFHSPPLECFLCTDHVENKDRSKNQEYKWSWVFATWALASLSDYIDAKSRPHEVGTSTEPSQDPLNDKVSDSFALEHMHELPVESTEALGFARLFSEREELAERGSSRRKKISQSVSKHRLDSYHSLKLAIVTEFNQLDRSFSNRKAAKIIYDCLPEKDKYSFLTDDPTHQIEKWLSQYAKGSLPGQDRLPPYQQ